MYFSPMSSDKLCDKLTLHIFRGGHLLGGATNSMGAKEREPLRMGTGSQSKHRLNMFVHE